MPKSVAFMPRKPGMSRKAFREYYEHRHAILGARHFPFRKYARNHLMENEPLQLFDCYSEFWVEDFEPVVRCLEGNIGEVMRSDERNFTDQPRIVSAFAREELLFGEGRPGKEDGAARRLLLLKTQPGEDALTALRKMGANGASFPVRRMTVDFLRPFRPGKPLPADAVLSLWPADGPFRVADVPLPECCRPVASCRCTSFETIDEDA